MTFEMMYFANRSLSIVVDISCDPNSPNNPLPFYDACTSFKEPTCKVNLTYVKTMTLFLHYTYSSCKFDIFSVASEKPTLVSHVSNNATTMQRPSVKFPSFKSFKYRMSSILHPPLKMRIWVGAFLFAVIAPSTDLLVLNQKPVNFPRGTKYHYCD